MSSTKRIVPLPKRRKAAHKSKYNGLNCQRFVTEHHTIMIIAVLFQTEVLLTSCFGEKCHKHIIL